MATSHETAFAGLALPSLMATHGRDATYRQASADFATTTVTVAVESKDEMRMDGPHGQELHRKAVVTIPLVGDGAAPAEPKQRDEIVLDGITYEIEEAIITSSVSARVTMYNVAQREPSRPNYRERR